MSCIDTSVFTGKIMYSLMFVLDHPVKNLKRITDQLQATGKYKLKFLFRDGDRKFIEMISFK